MTKHYILNGNCELIWHNKSNSVDHSYIYIYKLGQNTFTTQLNETRLKRRAKNPSVYETASAWTVIKKTSINPHKTVILSLVTFGHLWEEDLEVLEVARLV